MGYLQTLGFSNSNNIIVSGVTSLNSQMFHIVINGCNNVKLQGVRVSASGNSPNTDGIHVQKSSGVTILNSKIATGDDCVSIGPGTTNLWIENIACGPGHGIRYRLIYACMTSSNNSTKSKHTYICFTSILDYFSFLSATY